MVEVPDIVTAAQHGVPKGKNAGPLEEIQPQKCVWPRPSESASQKHFFKSLRVCILSKCGTRLFDANPRIPSKLSNIVNMLRAHTFPYGFSSDRKPA